MSCLFILQKNEYTCNTQLLLNKPLFLHISPPPPSLLLVKSKGRVDQTNNSIM